MNKAHYINKCNELGIILENDRKYRNIDLVRELGAHFAKSIDSKALELRMQIESPMLAARYTDLKLNQRDVIFESEDWIAETKFNGCRCLIIYVPETGFHFFSRNVSSINFLPVDFTKKVLLLSQDLSIEKKPHEYMNAMNGVFILDAEIVANKNIDTSVFNKYGTQTKSEQNATTAILEYLEDDCYRIQRTQSQLEFHVFDCIYYNEWIMDRTFKNRKFIQETIVKKLNQAFPELRFHNAQIFYTKKEKEDAWEFQLQNRGEGLIFKNLNKQYHPHESRQKDIIIKMKRSMKLAANIYDLNDLDMYISGYELPDPESKFKDYIGSVKFSVTLNKKDGTQVEHHLATVSGMTLELKRLMSEIDPVTNLPFLKKEYYGKVCSIDGMSVTKNMKFSHAKSNFIFREDKSAYECIIDEQFLLQNII